MSASTSHIHHRSLDDLRVGEVFSTQGYTLTQADITSFAFAFDPQPFHIDAVAAEQSIFGGQIASGFHTIALCFRLFIQSGIFNNSSLGGTGLDEVRWFAPVRPGDTLRAEVEVISLHPSKSKAERGVAVLQYRGYNQRQELVVSFYGNHYLLR
ncbi:MaoC family dehydratase [Fluviibacter phosphoraccumulans]|uniref:MaoC family dehydratase n=1 Tax=Fluviibacter phosphoraccumulans TaxID=1751046 RepID=UPI001F5BC8D3|nr:MaoC family dehydratase [Fluviibacter phosphoraccumulans]